MTSSQTKVVKNGTVIDGTGAPPINNAAVIIEGERITAVGPLERLEIPTDATIIDAKGGTITPGIINSHGHFAMQAAEVLPVFLADGVTSLGDTGSLREDVAILHEIGTRPDAARCFASGPCLTAVGGYPALRDPAVAVEIDGPESARAAVDEVASLSVDYIKIAQEPFNWNFQDPGYLPFLSAEDIATIIERAHEHGLRVRSHLRYGSQLDYALDGGIDSVEHLLFPFADDMRFETLYEVGQLDIATLPQFEERIARMVEQDVYLVPTVQIELENLARGRPDLSQEAIKAVEDFSVAVVYAYHQAGGHIALGNDWVGMPAIETGMPLTEMRYLIAAEMTPVEVIQTSTRNAAYVIGQEQNLGTLEAGKLADLIIVQDDPLVSIEAFAEVAVVIKGGAVVHPTISGM